MNVAHGLPVARRAQELGNRHTTYTRFSRWNRTRAWARLLTAVRADLDPEEDFLDSTAIRAHLHAAGAPKKTATRALGRSRGGWGTKIHMMADALGNPLSFTLTGAQQADITQAPLLLDGVRAPQAVIADKGYDADALVASIHHVGAVAVIPPRSHRLEPRTWERHRYRVRHLIENLFARLKRFRRLATQFAGFVMLASLSVWLA